MDNGAIWGLWVWPCEHTWPTHVQVENWRVSASKVALSKCQSDGDKVNTYPCFLPLYWSHILHFLSEFSKGITLQSFIVLTGLWRFPSIGFLSYPFSHPSSLLFLVIISCLRIIFLWSPCMSNCKSHVLCLHCSLKYQVLTMASKKRFQSSIWKNQARA